MRAWAILVLLLSASVAGCLKLGETTPPVDAPPGNDAASFVRVMDATDGLERARSLALAWRSDAALTAVVGAEGAHAQPEDPPFLYDSRADPDVGDGLAVAWTYIFQSASTPRRFVATLAADGSTPYAQDLDSGYVPTTETRLPGIPMSSKAAADLVLANESARTFAREHPVSVGHMALFPHEDGAGWEYARTTTTGFALQASINATTGTLVEVRRYPDDLQMYAPCGPGMECGVATSYPVPAYPTPPPTPPEERTSKNSTLNAFNQQARFDVEPRHGYEFAHKLVLAADVPGSTPLDERTLRLYDAMGMPLAERSGTGRLEIVVDDGIPLYGPYRAVLESKAPPAVEQTVAFTAVVTYGAWLGWGTWMESSGGLAGFQQVDDRTFRVPENATNLSFRIAFQSSTPATRSDASPTTWQVLDPAGNVIANGTAPGGRATVSAPAAGTYTVRVTGGAGAVYYGESYQYSVHAAMPQYVYH